MGHLPGQDHVQLSSDVAGAQGGQEWRKDSRKRQVALPRGDGRLQTAAHTSLGVSAQFLAPSVPLVLCAALLLLLISASSF